MRSKIRILYLAPCWPAGPAFGTKLRVAQIAAALQEIGELDFVVVKLADDDDETAAAASKNLFRVRRLILLQPVRARSLRQRVQCHLNPRRIDYYGHFAAEPDRNFVFNELANYDLVWLHHLRTANALGRWRWKHSVMDLDDVPSTFFRAARDNGRNVGERLRAGFQMRLARRRERLLGERFDALSVCSEADRAHLGLGKKTHVIPNGFARPVGEPVRSAAQPPRFGFVGTFEYLPNVENVRWLVNECWPLIKKQLPAARLRLAGKGSEIFKSAGNDIDALGWIENAAAEMATWSAMVVPVRRGAGTRVKIADGFSRKCPMVSTSLGAFGYDVADGAELFLADTAENFARACVRIVRQPAEAAAMAERGWRRFLEKWTWDAIRPRVWAAAQDGLRNGAD